MIIFLDIDGVLHPNSGSALFVSSCMQVLEDILLNDLSVEIVITSSWREEKSLSEIKALLGQCIGSHVIGHTPIIDDPFLKNVRYHEVMQYLESIDNPIRRWIAIDDEPGNYPSDSPVIFTDRRKGLTPDDGIKIKQLISSLQLE